MTLAACGGGSNTASGKTTSGSGSSGTSTKLTGTVHFTAIAPLTGSYAALGLPVSNGAKAAADLINKAGGVLGKKLVIDPVDTKGDPADAATALSQEISLNHPKAIIGPITLEIHGVQPIFDRYKIPDGWNGGSAAYDTNTDPYLFRCNASDSEEGIAIAGYAAQQGYKTAAMIFSTSAASQAFEPIIKKYYTSLGGKIVATESIQPTLNSYSSEVQAVINSHPTVIFTQMEPGTASAVFKNMQALGGITIPWIGTDFMAGATVIQAIGPTVSKAHMVEVQGSTSSSGGGVAKFDAAVKGVTGKPPESGTNFAYDCTIDMALAMDKAGSTTGTKVIKALPEVSNPPGTTVVTYAKGYADIKAGKKINYQGVSGPMNFNKYNNVTGAWSVVQAKGTKTGQVTVLKTITPQTITKFIHGQT